MNTKWSLVALRSIVRQSHLSQNIRFDDCAVWKTSDVDRVEPVHVLCVSHLACRTVE